MSGPIYMAANCDERGREDEGCLAVCRRRCRKHVRPARSAGSPRDHDGRTRSVIDGAI